MPRKQQDLPGMENRAINELESLAYEYVELRDKRLKILDAEVDRKNALLALMHKHGKQEYNHDGLRVWIVAEEETVKVKVQKSDVSVDADGGKKGKGKKKARK